MELNKNTYPPEVLAQMNTAELEQLLQGELQKPTCDINADLVRSILSEIEARGKDSALMDDESIEVACSKFRETGGNASPRKLRWYNNWFVKVASVVVVLGIMFFSAPQMTEAETVKDVLTRWTDSVFHFFSPGEDAFTAEDYVFETDHPGLQEIYDAVIELGITDPVVPMWVPDGFELQEIKTHQMKVDSSIFACLVKEEKCILITLVVHNEQISFQHEKNAQNIETIEFIGIEHYIMTNKGERIVAWMTNGIECSIVADCPEEDVYRLLKSIYIPEG